MLLSQNRPIICSVPTNGCNKAGGGGIARAIVDVTVGNSIESFLYPKYAPTKTNGIETQHHIAATMMTSKNGADADECKNQRMMLKNKNIPNANPGKSNAVTTVQSCHIRPLKDLYNRLLT